jgi:hypothetical protein
MRRILSTLATVIGAATLISASAAQATPLSDQRPAGVVKANTPGVFPHSADYDPLTRRFVVGSLKHNTISTVDLKGTVRTVVTDPKAVSIQAIRIDRRQNRVLASSVDYGVAVRSSPETAFRIAQVSAYDRSTWRRLWRTDLAAVTSRDEPHLIADIVTAPDGTSYAADQLSPVIYRIDRHGRASVFLRDKAFAGTLSIPGYPAELGLSALAWQSPGHLLATKADGSLYRIPLTAPRHLTHVALPGSLSVPAASIRTLSSGSILVLSSGLLTGQPALVQRVDPLTHNWKRAAVHTVATVTDPVTSALVAGPGHADQTYALSGGLAALFAGQPDAGFTLTPVTTR